MRKFQSKLFLVSILLAVTSIPRGAAAQAVVEAVEAIESVSSWLSGASRASVLLDSSAASARMLQEFAGVDLYATSMARGWRGLPRAQLLTDGSSLIVNPEAINPGIFTDYYSRAGGSMMLWNLRPGEVFVGDLGLSASETDRFLGDNFDLYNIERSYLLPSHEHSDHYRTSNDELYRRLLEVRGAVATDLRPLFEGMEPNDTTSLSDLLVKQPVDEPFLKMDGIGDIAYLRIQPTADSLRSAQFMRYDAFGPWNSNHNVVISRFSTPGLNTLRLSDASPRLIASLLEDPNPKVASFVSDADVLYWPHHAWVPRTEHERKVMTELLERVSPSIVVVYGRHHTQARENLDTIAKFVRRVCGDSVLVIPTDSTKSNLTIISLGNRESSGERLALKSSRLDGVRASRTPYTKDC